MDEDFTSKYQRLEVPSFDKVIPEHLLKNGDPERRFLLESVCEINQKQSWIIQALVQGNHIHRDLDMRQSRIEAWKANFTPKWALLSALGLVILSSTVTVLIKKLVEHITSVPMP